MRPLSLADVERKMWQRYAARVRQAAEDACRELEAKHPDADELIGSVYVMQHQLDGLCHGLSQHQREMAQRGTPPAIPSPRNMPRPAVKVTGQAGVPHHAAIRKSY